MFSLNYSANGGVCDARVFAPAFVNSALEIIFNGIFEAHISRQIRAKSRFLPGKTLSAALVYHPAIKHGAAPLKAPCF
jgi:hypothetical protein